LEQDQDIFDRELIQPGSSSDLYLIAVQLYTSPLSLRCCADSTLTPTIPYYQPCSGIVVFGSAIALYPGDRLHHSKTLTLSSMPVDHREGVIVAIA